MLDLSSQVVAKIEILDLFQSLGLAVLFGLVLSWVVQRYSQILGSRSQYRVIFMTLIPTMVLIISIIKSSLALSLGLVGALSIVRFRTPIKEPEELVYLFVAIAVGLGLGADQTIPTSICFFVIMGILIAVAKFQKRHVPRGLFLDVEARPTEKMNLKSVSEVMERHRIPFEMRRFVDDDTQMNVTFYIEPPDRESLHGLMGDFKSALNDARLTLIDRPRQLG